MRIIVVITTLFILSSVSFSRAVFVTDKPPHWKYLASDLSRQDLARALIDLDVQHPEMVYRQAMLESRRLKSMLCQKGNNLFGMKRPSKRETYALDETLYGHATYSHWVYSVLDYKLWQGDDPIRNYGRFLIRRKYAETEDYVLRLKSVFISDTVMKIFAGEKHVK